MKRILITGAAGKIGSLLRKGLRGFAAQSSRRIRRAARLPHPMDKVDERASLKSQSASTAATHIGRTFCRKIIKW
jgi:nucleoside-diphosphate-sugar epimerase